MALEKNEFFPLFVLKLGVWNKSEFRVYLVGILNPIKLKKYHRLTLYQLNHA
jgi:hypothetical protein